jgi:hypothetical protein
MHMLLRADYQHTFRWHAQLDSEDVKFICEYPTLVTAVTSASSGPDLHDFALAAGPGGHGSASVNAFSPLIQPTRCCWASFGSVTSFSWCATRVLRKS